MNVGKVPNRESSNLFTLTGDGEEEAEDSDSSVHWNKDNQDGEEWADLDNLVAVVEDNTRAAAANNNSTPGRNPVQPQGQAQMVQLQHVQQYVDNAMKTAWANVGPGNAQQGEEKVMNCLEKITEVLQTK